MFNINSALKSAKYAIIGAALALAPAAASAFSVTPLGSYTQDTAGDAFALTGMSGNTVGFAWANTKGAGNKAVMVQAFEVVSDVDFTITLTSYEVLQGTGNGTLTNLFFGERTRGGVTSPFTQLSATLDESNVGEQLITLSPGVYAIRVLEDGKPNSGYMTFALAPVPLPAGIALMLGALGGLVVIRRRKSATA